MCSVVTDWWHWYLHTVLGKFSSDCLEQRFGRFRPLSGANLFISCKQLLEAEKKVRILSLIRDGISPSEVAAVEMSLETAAQDIDSEDLLSFSSVTNEDISSIKLEDQATIYVISGRSALLRSHEICLVR